MKKLIIFLFILLLPVSVQAADLYAYQKVADKYTTYTVFGSQDCKITELCVVNGIAYILVDGVLPEQLPDIQKTLKQVILNPTLKKLIADNSPTIKLTKKRMSGEEPETRYSDEDEILLKQLSEFFDSPEAQKAHVDKGRLWFKSEETSK